jgi:hypothetical protein
MPPDHLFNRFDIRHMILLVYQIIIF